MTWEFESVVQLDSITEGPAWNGEVVLFTNIATDRVMSYNPTNGELSVLRSGTNHANGLMYDEDGRLYACESGARRMVRYKPEGGVVDLCDNFEGKRLNSPNDLAIDKFGRIWFSDPRYGDFRDDMELDHESILRLDPQGDGTYAVKRMTVDTTSPNGLLVSPDCKTLFVAQSKYGPNQLRELRAYPILENGELGDYEVLHNFYPHRGIDGMCFDVDGNIVACAGWEESGPGGMIYVFAPNGRVLETHPVPVDRPTNCTFGGPDLTDLFVTSIDGQLLHAKTDRKGHLNFPQV